MPRFFLPCDDIAFPTVRIEGEDAHHIAMSLRMAVGEPITVCDRIGRAYDCELSLIRPDFVEARVLSQVENSTEPPFRVTLVQSLPKSDKMETIIQKSVECGVYEITPCISERSIVKLTGDNTDKKLQRWQKISKEAAKQSSRGIIPKVNSPISLASCLESATEYDLAVFFYEGDTECTLNSLLSQYKKERKRSGDVPKILMVVGPEGGFSDAEVKLAKSKGFKLTGLGKRILRCESAAMFALACIVYEFELNT